MIIARLSIMIEDKRVKVVFIEHALKLFPNSENPEARPWCYNAEDTGPRWNYCDIPACVGEFK